MSDIKNLRSVELSKFFFCFCRFCYYFISQFINSLHHTFQILFAIEIKIHLSGSKIYIYFLRPLCSRYLLIPSAQFEQVIPSTCNCVVSLLSLITVVVKVNNPFAKFLQLIARNLFNFIVYNKN